MRDLEFSSDLGSNTALPHLLLTICALFIYIDFPATTWIRAALTRIHFFMNWVERSIEEILRVYIEEEGCEPRKVDIDDAIELVQSLDGKLKRVKRRPLQDACQSVLIRIQKNYVHPELVTLGHEETNKMNKSVINLWNVEQGGSSHEGTKPEDGGPTAREAKKKSTAADEKLEKKRRKKLKTESSKNDNDSDAATNEPRPKSTATLADLGGIDDIITQVLELMAMPLSHPEIFMQLGSDIPRGVLLHGPPGCGKTVLANALANELGCSFLSISAPALVSGMSGESEKKLRELFEEARNVAPCLIFIDEIDAITPKRETAQREMERRIVAQFLTCMDDVSLDKTGGRPVMVIGATNRPDSIDPALRRGGRFDHEICMSVPDQAARHRILQTLARNLKVDGSLDFEQLSKMTPGYVGADLNALVAAAGVAAIKRIFRDLSSQDPHPEVMEAETEEIADSSLNKLTPQPQSVIRQFLSLHPDPLSPEELEPLAIRFEDFLTALPQVQPSSKREGFATVPDVTWNDVGAMKPIREELEYAVVAPIRHPEMYAAAGISAPSGVLLWGPPGCGKTLLAKAVANESKANFISVRGPELLNKYVGESERAVRQVFVRARASVPCIIFFDELDALVPKRDDAQSEASSRVVNTLLTELDGTGDRNGVFVVAATNRPDMIDQAMLRPGRLDKQLFVELPTPSERADILVTVCRKSKTPLGPNVDLAIVANDDRCRNFSGADLAALSREAAVMALKRSFQSRELVTVTMDDFDAAFAKVRPSVNDAERLKYNIMKETLAT